MMVGLKLNKKSIGIFLNLEIGRTHLGRNHCETLEKVFKRGGEQGEGEKSCILVLERPEVSLDSTWPLVSCIGIHGPQHSQVLVLKPSGFPRTRPYPETRPPPLPSSRVLKQNFLSAC